MNELTISGEEPGRKLMVLEEMLPGANPAVCDFGRYLADYMIPQLTPSDFVSGCQLALEDLRIGISVFTGKPVENSLTGQPPVFYSLLWAEIPNIADAIFPPHFAQAVKDFVVGANIHLEFENEDQSPQ